MNINRLAGSLKKDYTTISEYVQILQDSGLLRFLLQNKQGHALVRDAEKIYLDNPNILYALNKEIGKEPLIGLSRELFVISSLQNANYHVFSLNRQTLSAKTLFLRSEARIKLFLN